MLNYTSKNGCGIIKALYHAPSAYFLPRSKQEREALDLHFYFDNTSLVKNHPCNDFSQSYPDLSNTIHVLAHEYIHRKIYNCSRSGRKIHRMWLWVKSYAIFKNSVKSIEKYHAMRTVHYMETKECHERFVDETLLECITRHQPVDLVLKGITSKEIKRIIKKSEENVRGKWGDLGFELPLFYNPVQILIAYLTSSWCPRFPGQDWYPEDAGSDMQHFDHKHIFLSNCNFFQRIKLAITTQKSAETLLEWYWVGQRTQFDVLKKYYGMSFESFRDSILVPHLSFIMEWTDIPIEQHDQFIELYEDTLLLDRTSFRKRWLTGPNRIDLGKSLNVFLHYFYNF